MCAAKGGSAADLAPDGGDMATDGSDTAVSDCDCKMSDDVFTATMLDNWLTALPPLP